MSLCFSNKKYNQTLVVITHDENIALQADCIISIEDGCIAKDEVDPLMRSCRADAPPNADE